MGSGWSLCPRSGRFLKLRCAHRHHHPAPTGNTEAGIDGGGLFKDFMDELLRQGFDTQVGDMGL